MNAHAPHARTAETVDGSPAALSDSTASPGAPERGLPIWLDHVSKWYGPVMGVNEVTLRVESGIVALLGANGAGKSTLMKLLTGQLSPSLGRLRVFGRSVRSPAARRKIGYCPHVNAFYEEMTGRQFVTAMLRLAGYRADEARERAERAVATVGMADRPGQQRAAKRIKACSKGMRQRIKLAQAIAHDPELLILDEPLSGLDPVGRADFARLFRQLAGQNKTVLISSHVLTEVEQLADQVILMRQGRVVAQGSRSQVARYLKDVPQRVMAETDRQRELAARLVLAPEVLDIRFPNGNSCAITTRDPDALCARIAALVRDEQFRIDRLVVIDHWAESLFSVASEGVDLA